MTCTKQISMTGYLVRYVDLREAKPRAAHESVYVMDKDALTALGLLGLNVADFITARYERAAATTLSEWSESSRSAQQKSICSKSGSAQPPPPPKNGR